MQPLLAGLEAGGTKMVAAIGTSPADLKARTVIPTAEPAGTIAALIRWFTSAAVVHGPVSALGIASFGPVELRPGHPGWGRITTTTKPGWSGTDVAGPLGEALGVPVGFDSDVNGAALGEWRWGAARGLATFVYLTVGTGIGGGGLVGGRLIHGLVHPEMGHMRLPRHPDDTFAGSCPYHGDCLEGLAAGPAIAARWCAPAHALGDLEDRAVELEAHYLAGALATITYVIAPERIVLGGGVSKLPGLLDAVRRRLVETLGGYPGLPDHGDEIEEFVVPPGLGDDSGVAGGLALAEQAMGEAHRAL